VILSLLAGAASEVQCGLAVEPDASFTARTGLYLAQV
jgi:hypothetical protein